MVRMRSRVRLAMLALLLVCAAVLAALTARAFAPPELRGHVTDEADVISAGDRGDLEERLEAYRAHTGIEIDALILPSLYGESIEDVAQAAWSHSKLAHDVRGDAVLVVLSIAERAVRIEIGPAAAAALSEEKANDIIRNVMGPLIAEHAYYAAIRDGTGAIMRELGGGVTASSARHAPESQRATRFVTSGVIVFFLLLILLRLLFRGGGFRGGGGGRPIHAEPRKIPRRRRVHQSGTGYNAIDGARTTLAGSRFVSRFVVGGARRMYAERGEPGARARAQQSSGARRRRRQASLVVGGRLTLRGRVAPRVGRAEGEVPDSGKRT
jgi:uncharacterized protein